MSDNRAFLSLPVWPGQFQGSSASEFYLLQVLLNSQINMGMRLHNSLPALIDSRQQGRHQVITTSTQPQIYIVNKTPVPLFLCSLPFLPPGSCPVPPPGKSCQGSNLSFNKRQMPPHQLLLKESIFHCLPTWSPAFWQEVVLCLCPLASTNY